MSRARATSASATRFVIQNIHRYFLYAALVFIGLLAYDALLAFRFPDGIHVHVGTLVLCTNVVLLGGYTFGCHSLRHIVGGRKDQLPRMRSVAPATTASRGSTGATSCSRGAASSRSASPTSTCACAPWPVDRRRLFRVAAATPSFEHPTWPNTPPTSTTSSSSEPAAPDCAPPSRPPPRASTSPSSCKSLLGKAHTVMAEGGMAAAMANVDDRDSWKVHFADTMRGGQYTRGAWRAARQGSARARARARGLGRGLRSHQGRPHPAAQLLGGHRYPRLAHVGDRTGLELIRTLQDHGIHRGMKVYMEHHHGAAAQGRRPRNGAFGYDRERGRFHVAREGGGARDRRHRPRVQDHLEQLGVHRRRPVARVTPAPS
ncbi:MAG: hypothetical protein U0168_21960 [Nannocystaceae bacterium]